MTVNLSCSPSGTQTDTKNTTSHDFLHCRFRFSGRRNNFVILKSLFYRTLKNFPTIRECQIQLQWKYWFHRREITESMMRPAHLAAETCPSGAFPWKKAKVYKRFWKLFRGSLWTVSVFPCITRAEVALSSGGRITSFCKGISHRGTGFFDHGVSCKRQTSTQNKRIKLVLWTGFVTGFFKPQRDRKTLRDWVCRKNSKA